MNAVGRFLKLFEPENTSVESEDQPVGLRDQQDLMPLTPPVLTIAEISKPLPGSTQQDGKLPVELWKEIFILVTTFPRKDEFSTSSSTYGIIRSQNSSHSAALTLAEQIEVAKTRNSIVRVCKYWYSLGIYLLWSHLRIGLFGGESKQTTQLAHIMSKLNSDPNLGLSVIRLTVYIPPDAGPVFRSTLEHVIGHLPSIQILVSTTETGLSSYRCQPAVMLFKDPRFTDYRLSTAQLVAMDSLWANLRTLSISCGPEFRVPLPIFKLPVLDTLRIDHEGGDLAFHILERWIMPCLRAFAMQDHPVNTSPVQEFLIEKGELLEKLQLELTRAPEQVTPLPYLHALDLGWESYEWVDFIRASRLRRLGFFNLPAWITDFEDWISKALILFPTVNELHLSGFRQSSFLQKGGSCDKYYNTLLERGIHVYIHGN